ncbi:right-handed parallel beta-helix repeat-containing protein [Sodalis sp. dw_96]|uniref:right-handed parallel beta-helix repeat-containing protein n=1 Tax=Sodalis sp. dw_96 TaxID=2719794 RepID=UPI00210287E1|nr:right-handed parallel beta-helix repeat-containing protein [Sodalis sp. dw_96]
MKMQQHRTLLAGAVLLTLPILSNAEPVSQAPADTIAVTSYADDGSQGTLRWAIEKNNQAPGHYRIELSAIGKGPFIIQPTHELPPILGPVVMENRDWARNGTYVTIDGSGYVTGSGPQACPGAVPGQYGANVRTTTKPGLILRDTHGVEIRGLEVSNFCIGILINRVSDSTIEDSRIVGNKGGAGIMMTGDDGQGNSTDTTRRNKIVRNTFINNGDAMEATRGSSFNLIADNFITTDHQKNQEPSQGLEILWGNDNEIIRNHFENYSDGVQLNWGNRNYIAANTFTGLSSGVTLSGTGNIVDGNTMTGNRVAISVRPQGLPGSDGKPGINRIAGPAVNRITGNIMYGNGVKFDRCFAGGSCLPQMAGAIVFNVPGLEHGRFIGNRGGGIDNDAAKLEKICALDGQVDGCESTPNYDQQAPRLTAVQPGAGKGRAVFGQVTGQPNTLYRVEIFSNSDPWGTEAEHYLGFVMVPVNAAGKGNFVYSVDPFSAVQAADYTATATTADGATSPLSRPLMSK